MDPGMIIILTVGSWALIAAIVSALAGDMAWALREAAMALVAAVEFGVAILGRAPTS